MSIMRSLSDRPSVRRLQAQRASRRRRAARNWQARDELHNALRRIRRRERRPRSHVPVDATAPTGNPSVRTGRPRRTCRSLRHAQPRRTATRARALSAHRTRRKAAQTCACTKKLSASRTYEVHVRGNVRAERGSSSSATAAKSTRQHDARRWRDEPENAHLGRRRR